MLNEGTRSLPTKTSIFILASEILSCDFMAGIELPHSGMNEQPFPHQVRRGPFAAHACALSFYDKWPPVDDNRCPVRASNDYSRLQFGHWPG